MKFLIILALLSNMAFAELTKKERKKCIKQFKKWEKRRKDKDLVKLKKLSCIEDYEIGHEYNRAMSKSPSTTREFNQSKFQFKKNKVKKMLKSYFSTRKSYADTFEAMKMVEPNKYKFRLSTCKLELTHIEKNTRTQVNDKDWAVTFQLKDTLIHIAFGNDPNKDQVSSMDEIVDTHYSRLWDKARKKLSKVFMKCLFRDFK
jgi:hypothetical protein